MNIHLYGIPNCDSVKKARAWLDARALPYAFHDYKREGADAAKLRAWSEAAGWETLLNRRGTTFRKLDQVDTAELDQARALRLMAEHPSLIRRPVLEHEGGLLIGFDVDSWQRALA